MRSDYINDGYTEEGYIALVPGLHGELRFTFRPFLVEERSQVTAGLREVKAELHNRKYAIEAAKKVVAWNLTDSGGKAVEVKADNVYRLRPALFDRLIDIMLGMKPSDIDPLATPAKKDAAVEDQFAAALGNVTVGQLTEEAAEKN